MYSRVLLDCIEREKNGIDYICPDQDKEALRKLLEEINEFAGTEYRYLAELDAFKIPGAGQIIEQHISQFASESVRSYLVPHLVFDKIVNCDRIVLQMYLHFKGSEEYISNPGKPAPVHIYVRYDNAFRSLRSKRLKGDLLELANHPRDAFYLFGGREMEHLQQIFDFLVVIYSVIFTN